MSSSATLQPTSSARSLMPLWLLVLIAIVTLGTAWYYEIVVGFIPCELCLKERIPYYIGILIGVIGLGVAAMGGHAKTVRWLALAAGLVFLIGAGLGVYHAGVEWKFWLGPADCAGRSVASGKASDLLTQMQSLHVVSCTDAPWHLLGLSFAGWNAVISFVLALLGFKAFSSRAG